MPGMLTGQTCEACHKPITGLATEVYSTEYVDGKYDGWWDGEVYHHHCVFVQHFPPTAQKSCDYCHRPLRRDHITVIYIHQYPNTIFHYHKGCVGEAVYA